MMPEEGAQASVDLRAKRYCPVHWGMFPLSLHRWRDPIERIYTFHENGTINLVAPILGEVVEVSGDYQLEPWWRTVESK